jgi:PAS domain S-box-containing protein
MIGQAENSFLSHFKALFENAGMAILVTDHSGKIVAINPFALNEFEYDANELADKKIDILIPDHFLQKQRQYHLDHIEEPKSRLMAKGKNLLAVKKDGTVFAVDISLGYCENEGEKYVIIFINNVLDHKNNQPDIIKLNHELGWEVEQRTKDLKETLKQLEITNQELNKAISFRDAILHNAGAIIISGDLNGIIQTFNPEAENELGYNAEELVGKQNVLIFHDADEIKRKAKQISVELKKDIPANTEVFFAKARLGMHSEYEWTYLRKDGTKFPVLLTVTAMKNEKNEIIGFLGVAINISEQKKIEKELQESLDKEKELSELKSRFVSIASHEFRTPLSTVLLSAYLIEKYTSGEDQPKRQKHLHRIISSVNMLTDILNDFLNVGKIEEGKIEVRYSEFNIMQAIQGFIEEIKNTLKKGQEIFYRHEGEQLVKLDASMMRHIMLNLISNASKFSGESKPIEITSENRQNQIILSVKDYGIGISKEDQRHLMERFFRGANAGNIQGTGLGLHIVSKYAELMNGTLECKSELEKGTEFVISFNKTS